ncbi:MAG: zinc metallopeptidase [Proteobacteria bacterium]|nr:zinc metallopeptidase [Pseudomonadota bacterium]
MLYIVLIVLFLAAAFGPSVWAKWVLHRHNEDRLDFPGTGGELAQHLVTELGLSDVIVERTDAGSHYDPVAKAIRLEPAYFTGRSVSAVAVAAHEVGHAVQDHQNYGPLRTRHQLITKTIWIQRFARYAMYAAPIVGILSFNPRLALATILIGFLGMGISVVIHLATLPVELDASFGRALPVLEHDGYLATPDMPAARSVLRACALTYVADALMTMFNFWTWFRALR